MRRTRFFVLDTPHPGSLTLRDYSKVVAGHKQSLSKKKTNSPEMSGGSMMSLRRSSSKPCPDVAQLKTVCLAFAVCLFLPTLLTAQGTGGRILGRVSDPTGAVLSGVKITATNDATAVSQESMSNDSGDFSFPNVPVG